MPPPLCSDDRRELLALARAAITEAVLHDRILNLPQGDGRLAEPAGAFVTLYHRGRLRGCVGVSGRTFSLSETVAQCALSAARNDARFAALGAGEVSEVVIEISVLSEPRAIAPGAIEAGTHGLLVIRGRHRGLLLPQLAAERAWTALRFLEETCRKAGLQPDAWRHPETELLAFTAEVFSEREFDRAAPGAAMDLAEREYTPNGGTRLEKSGPAT
jgi:AmmeMemoRadiSam system protein A